MMFFNVIHRPEATSDAMLESLKFQIDAAHKVGLKASNLISFLGLQNQKVIDLLKQARDTHGDEVGLHLHEYYGDVFVKLLGIHEKAFWLNSLANKKRILDLFIEWYAKHFGAPPASIGSYYIDADTLAYIEQTYPSVECVIATCFQEGCNMFRGTCSMWHLFNEGGPWWPWYPSRRHVLCPAGKPEDASKIVALPHLVRDMVLSINDRNDYFASHPGNIMRGKAYGGPDMQYDLNFIDQYIAQSRYNNGYSYYNIFVSLPWITGDYAQEEPIAAVRGRYVKELEYLARLKAEGKAQDCTMVDFARWFKANRKPGQMDSCYWQDILCGSGREAFWEISESYRVCVDSVLGGAICDLRPYAGQIENSTGADQKGLWIGSYPFIINSHKRSGEPPHYGRASTVSTVISDGTHSVNLCDHRIAMEKFDPATRTLTLAAKQVQVGAATVTVQNRYIFQPKDILLETTILEAPAGSKLSITHYISAAPGFNEYPQDMRGIILYAENETDRETLTVAYASKAKTLPNPRSVWAVIPQLNIEVSLTPRAGADTGLIEDEHLFSPYFNLSLTKAVAKGGALQSCLRIKSLS